MDMSTFWHLSTFVDKARNVDKYQCRVVEVRGIWGVCLLPGVEIEQMSAVAMILPLCGRFINVDKYKHEVVGQLNPMVVFVHIFLSTSVHIWFFECVAERC